jgi:hypothetical protein
MQHGDGEKMDLGTVQDLIARWWFHYDQGLFDAWPRMVTDDVVFTCRSDTGAAPYEEFLRADVHGRQDFLAWQREHRGNSPYPLRHNGTNVHLTGVTDKGTGFMSYLFVTQIVDNAVSNLSSGLCSGTARMDQRTAKLAALHVVLDTQNSVVFDTRHVGAGSN